MAQLEPIANAATTSAPGPPVWLPDRGDGTYKNPVLHADYSDQDVIRVGRDYYMTASSFHCMPGLPILHSRDLVNWQLVGHALTKQLPTDFFDIPQHGYGVWAPSLRFHNAEFLIYWGDPDHGVYVVKAKKPTGPWSAPTLILAGKGIIDPCPFWDDNGQAYLAHAWAASRAGINSVLTLRRMTPDGMTVLDEGKHIVDGHDQHHTLEGPKLYKRNGFYYLLAPAGGVATGWQLALRSKNIYGPYEAKIVLEQGKTAINGPHQGAWIDVPPANGKPGEDWFMHFQDAGAYGRVLHLQPLRWVNDWPIIGQDQDKNGVGEPVVSYRKPAVNQRVPVIAPANSDEFNSDTLALQWQWQANPRVTWSALMRGKGSLRLFAIPQPENAVNLWPTPNLLLQKFPAPDFTATSPVKLTVEWDTPGKKAGLLIMGNDYGYLSISRDSTGYKLRQVFCKDAMNQSPEQVVAEQPIPTGTAYLRVQVTGPDATCQFSYSLDGTVYALIGKPFKAQQEKWTGAKVGLFCTSQRGVRTGSYADVDWFRIEPVGQ
ncbi:glycoside hydrolase family 43 protein [Fibrella aquatica]|uniref:glycoside hydrolase family 43 protein n=1 Tax=Fibrella aquatica TaxID=3242487 RepID=UPI0035222E91